MSGRARRRWALGIEYDGSGFSGWQLQVGTRTVQEVVETALGRVADHPIRVHCSGRTDRGVHALQQIVHFDTVARRDPRAWVFGGNAHLPAGVSILWAREVGDDFHARFSARSRWYRYLLVNRPVRPAIGTGRVAWDYRPLDVTPMNEAAALLIGEHDFTSFRAVACQARSPVRTLHRLDVRRRGAWLWFDVEANAFLHHMVRNLAGVLMAIGAGEHPPEWAGEVLAARDRTRGGVTAPPDGLYFVTARYPHAFGLPGDEDVTVFP